MWPFGKAKPTIPKGCDFELVRDELAYFFRMANDDAAKEGARVFYKEEFLAGWERFAADPSMEAAVGWLNSAPDYEPTLMKYFARCAPGGRAYGFRHRPKAITLKPDERPIEQQAKQFGEETDLIVQHFPREKWASEALKLVVLTAAYHCLKGTEPYIRTEDEKDRSYKVFLINCEFFYFFMHLGSRYFFAGYGEAVGQRWQSELGPTYVTEFLDSMVGSWPQEMKEGIRSELYDKMNDAERDYAACRCVYPEDKKVFTGNTLFTKLARNVAELAGTTNPAAQFLIMDHAFHVFLCLGFQDRVAAVASELR